jgi:hypothetical protein
VRSLPLISKVALFKGAVYQYVCCYAFTVQLELNQSTQTAPPSNLLLKNMKHKKLIEIPPYYIDTLQQGSYLLSSNLLVKTCFKLCLSLVPVPKKGRRGQTMVDFWSHHLFVRGCGGHSSGLRGGRYHKN